MIVAKTSKTMLNNSGERTHPCLVSGFKGNSFSFTPLRIMFAVDLSLGFLFCCIDLCFFVPIPYCLDNCSFVV